MATGEALAVLALIAAYLHWRARRPAARDDYGTVDRFRQWRGDL